MNINTHAVVLYKITAELCRVVLFNADLFSNC